MKRENAAFVAVFIPVLIISMWMCAHVLADPDWYVGKTYDETTTQTETETERPTESEIALRFTKAPARAATTAPTTTEEPTTTEAPTTTEEPTEAPTEATTAMKKSVITHYSIEGKMMDPTLQDVLYTTLADYGMEWWMPYAIAQARTESGFYIYAVSKDGKDKGLFQYRERYWDAKASRIGMQGADIFNPVNQIYVYCFEVASRYHIGVTDVGQLISAHKTAGYGYDASYVDTVMGYVQKLKKEN